MRDENIFVVGKNSYIGNYFSKYASSLGANVTSVSSAECDFRDRESVLELFRSRVQKGCTVVFFAVINKPIDNSFRSLEQNQRIVRNFIDGQRLADIRRIIYLSSIDVFGRSPDLPVTEQSKIQPDTWYGLARYSCEWMLLSSTEAGCPVTVCRMPGTYGRSENDRSVIGRFIRGIQQHGKASIKGTGRTKRDFVFLHDVCRLLETLLRMKHHGAINMVTGQSKTALEIMDVIRKALECEFEVVHEPADETREFDLAFDNRLIHKLFPNFRFTDMETAIRESYSTLPADSHSTTI